LNDFFDGFQNEVVKLDLYMDDLMNNANPALDDARSQLLTWKANFGGISNLYYEDLKKGKLT